MSYEGYVQEICENGHYSITDAFVDFYHDEEQLCHICKSNIVWRNSVDETNGESFGIIDMEQFLINKAEFETCECCGHTKQISEAIYRIPTKQETKDNQQYEINGKYYHIDDKSGYTTNLHK